MTDRFCLMFTSDKDRRGAEWRVWAQRAQTTDLRLL